MVKAGEEAELVNAQRYTLTNSSDSLTYDQMYGLKFIATRPVRKRVRTDGVIFTLEGAGDHIIEADILVTTPEITTLIALTKLTSGSLPEKNWDVQTTDRTGTVDTLRFKGKVIALQLVRQQFGATWFHISIQTTDTEVTEV